MIRVPKGEYTIGTNEIDGFSADLEGPETTILLDEFYIDETTVTNEQFQRFVNETQYVTDSEKIGWSFVFDYFVDEDVKQTNEKVPNLHWYKVKGACWKHPEGPNSSIENRMDHPVVQVTRNDALAYCRWAKKSLPTEAQWEVAAKGGTNNKRFWWGDTTGLVYNNQFMANTWQGDFPNENTCDDGYAATAPVKAYKPNGYGLYQMIGNVWEWCLNPGKIDLEEFKTHSTNYFVEKFFDRLDDSYYAIKGGSFLCHFTYCKRYRIAARNGDTGFSAANNLGFRTVCNKVE